MIDLVFWRYRDKCGQITNVQQTNSIKFETDVESSIGQVKPLNSRVTCEILENSRVKPHVFYIRELDENGIYNSH